MKTFIRWFASLFRKKKSVQAVSGRDVVTPRIWGTSYNRAWARAMAQFCDNPKPIRPWFGRSAAHATHRRRAMAAHRIQRGCKVRTK